MQWKSCLPIWTLCTDNVLCVCNNGSSSNDNDECSDLGGGCSDGADKVQDNGNAGNGIGDGSTGGKDDSSHSGGDGKFASGTKLLL